MNRDSQTPSTFQLTEASTDGDSAAFEDAAKGNPVVFFARKTGWSPRSIYDNMHNGCIPALERTCSGQHALAPKPACKPGRRNLSMICDRVPEGSRTFGDAYRRAAPQSSNSN
jgi:hypothetical protein